MIRRNKKKNLVILLASLLVVVIIGIYAIDKLVNNKVVENIDIDQSKLVIKQSNDRICDATYFLKNGDEADKSQYSMSPECISLDEAGKFNVTIRYKGIFQGFTVVISE